jgi:hypothetical protein
MLLHFDHMIVSQMPTYKTDAHTAPEVAGCSGIVRAPVDGKWKPSGLSFGQDLAVFCTYVQ